MREPVRDKERLEHILSSINVLVEYKDRYTLDEAKGNPILYYGFVKHVEIIGEAVYMLTKEYKDSHVEVEWDAIEKMRHVLVHGYYQVSPEQLWETITKDVPTLKTMIEKLYNEL